MKIALIGTHGTGKTALAYMLASFAEKTGVLTHLISDVMRSSFMPVYDKITQDSACWCVSEQISRELRAKALGHEVIICDRSTIDPIMYLNTRDFPKSHRELTEFASDWMKSYDIIFYILPSECQLPRDRSYEKYQKEVDSQFNLYLESIFMNYLKTNIYRISTDDIFSRDVEEIIKTVVGEDEWINYFHG